MRNNKNPMITQNNRFIALGPDLSQEHLYTRCWRLTPTGNRLTVLDLYDVREDHKARPPTLQTFCSQSEKSFSLKE